MFHVEDNFLFQWHFEHFHPVGKRTSASVTRERGEPIQQISILFIEITSRRRGRSFFSSPVHIAGLLAYRPPLFFIFRNSAAPATSAKDFPVSVVTMVTEPVPFGVFLERDDYCTPAIHLQGREGPSGRNRRRNFYTRGKRGCLKGTGIVFVFGYTVECGRQPPNI